MLCQDEANVTDIATSSSYYGDPSIRPPRQVGPGYGSPPPVPVPDQNCYVETPCTRYRFLKKVGALNIKNIVKISLTPPIQC